MSSEESEAAWKVWRNKKGGLSLGREGLRLSVDYEYFSVWSEGRETRVPIRRFARRGQGWRASGQLRTEHGVWRVEDTLTPRGHTLVIDRRWHWRGTRLSRVRLGLDLTVPFRTLDFWSIPYISMNGNPGSKTVPTGMSKDGRPWIFREERTTAPGLMTLEAGGLVAGSYTEPGRSEETLCACSIVPNRDSYTLQTFFPYREGPLSFQGAACPGRREIQEQGLYNSRSGYLSPGGGYLGLEVAGNARFQRRFFVVLAPAGARRHGYARVWESAWRNLREPLAGPVSIRKMENLLWRSMEPFYVQKGKVAGFSGRVSRDGKPCGGSSIGWCVPTAMLAWLGLRRAIRGQDPRRAEKAIRAIEFYVDHAATRGGVFRTHYDLKQQRWSEAGLNAVQMGGAAYWLLRCTELLKGTKLFARRIRADRWKALALDFCDLALRTQRKDGAFCAHWSLSGRALGCERAMGVHAARAVLEAYRQTGKTAYLRAAERGAEYYGRTMVERELGYGDCTDILDSTTENDGAFVTDFYLELHRVTGSRRMLDLAIRSAEYCLCYMYTYNVHFPPETECGRRHMRTRGFSAISPETAFVCFWFAVQANPFLELWKVTGEKRWKEYATALIRASLQMMSEPGDTFGLDRRLVGMRAEVIPVLDTVKDQRFWKKGMTGYTWDTPVLWPAVFNLLNFAVVEDAYAGIRKDLEH